MNSILSYPSRGKWGKSSYRGNCTGHIIKDLLEFYQPKKFVEVFSGGGTGKDVAIDLGIKNSVHLDLNNGWNGLIHEIPTGSDFTFSHPPYWDIVKYESQRGSAHEDDLSNNMSYEEFITKLDKVNSKIYAALVNGGRHAFLCGDVRKNKKYYSIIKDMAWIGDLEIHMIKEQHNTVSGRKSYNGKFIPIAHELFMAF
ncbi:DNA modification methylase [Bacillus sporothermodurans]|uniref:DNA modification methylase n=1 Tax=Heyndrickxia sporothermodurans TaxID=46224 RepID=UPI00192AB667|nr:DNA modification methylase [Heyndrickxia sporothermodurans]MBL5783592.1 DNA modification methylase [Heyndrickxia sporothermodurans]